MTTDRQSELTRLYAALRSGNYNGATLQRFRQLVADEAKPQIEAAMRPAIARAAYRREARAAAAAAAQAAGRRFVERAKQRR